MSWSSVHGNWERPSRLFVPASAAAQAVAMRDLVRPEDVVDVARELDGIDPVWSITRWLRAQRDRGALRYIHDPIGGDMWRSPNDTLASGGGDCEDFAILAASMLTACHDADAAVVIGLCDLVPHAWIEGRDRAGYFLLEATVGHYYDQPPPYYDGRRHFAL